MRDRRELKEGKEQVDDDDEGIELPTPPEPPVKDSDRILAELMEFGLQKDNYEMILEKLVIREQKDKGALTKGQHKELLDHVRYLISMYEKLNQAEKTKFTEIYKRLKEYKSRLEAIKNLSNDKYGSKRAQVRFAVIMTRAGLAQEFVTQSYVKKIPTGILPDEEKQLVKDLNLRIAGESKRLIKPNLIEAKLGSVIEFANKLKRLSQLAFIQTYEEFKRIEEAKPKKVEQLRFVKDAGARYADNLINYLKEFFISLKSDGEREEYVNYLHQTMFRCLSSKDYSTYQAIALVLKYINANVYKIQENIIKSLMIDNFALEKYIRENEIDRHNEDYIPLRSMLGGELGQLEEQSKTLKSKLTDLKDFIAQSSSPEELGKYVKDLEDKKMTEQDLSNEMNKLDRSVALNQEKYIAIEKLILIQRTRETVRIFRENFEKSEALYQHAQRGVLEPGREPDALEREILSFDQGRTAKGEWTYLFAVTAYDNYLSQKMKQSSRIINYELGDDDIARAEQAHAARLEFTRKIKLRMEQTKYISELDLKIAFPEPVKDKIKEELAKVEDIEGFLGVQKSELANIKDEPQNKVIRDNIKLIIKAINAEKRNRGIENKEEVKEDKEGKVEGTPVPVPATAPPVIEAKQVKMPNDMLSVMLFLGKPDFISDIENKEIKKLFAYRNSFYDAWMLDEFKIPDDYKAGVPELSDDDYMRIVNDLCEKVRDKKDPAEPLKNLYEYMNKDLSSKDLENMVIAIEGYCRTAEGLNEAKFKKCIKQMIQSRFIIKNINSKHSFILKIADTLKNNFADFSLFIEESNKKLDPDEKRYKYTLAGSDDTSVARLAILRKMMQDTGLDVDSLIIALYEIKALETSQNQDVIQLYIIALLTLKTQQRDEKREKKFNLEKNVQNYLANIVYPIKFELFQFKKQLLDYEVIYKKLLTNKQALSEDQLKSLLGHLNTLKIKAEQSGLHETVVYQYIYKELNNVISKIEIAKTKSVAGKKPSKNALLAYADIMTYASIASDHPSDTFIRELQTQANSWGAWWRHKASDLIKELNNAYAIALIERTARMTRASIAKGAPSREFIDELRGHINTFDDSNKHKADVLLRELGEEIDASAEGKQALEEKKSENSRDEEIPALVPAADAINDKALTPEELELFVNKVKGAKEKLDTALRDFKETEDKGYSKLRYAYKKGEYYKNKYNYEYDKAVQKLINDTGEVKNIEAKHKDFILQHAAMMSPDAINLENLRRQFDNKYNTQNKAIAFTNLQALLIDNPALLYDDNLVIQYLELCKRPYDRLTQKDEQLASTCSALMRGELVDHKTILQMNIDKKGTLENQKILLTILNSSLIKYTEKLRDKMLDVTAVSEHKTTLFRIREIRDKIEALGLQQHLEIKQNPEERIKAIVAELNQSMDPADRRLAQMVAIYSSKMKEKRISHLFDYIDSRKGITVLSQQVQDTINRRINKLSLELRSYASDLALDQIRSINKAIEQHIQNDAMLTALKDKLTAFKQSMYLFVTVDKLDEIMKEIVKAEDALSRAELMRDIEAKERVLGLIEVEEKLSEENIKTLVQIEYKQSLLEKRKINLSDMKDLPDDDSLKTCYLSLQTTIDTPVIDEAFQTNIQHQLVHFEALHQNDKLLMQELISLCKAMENEVDNRSELPDQKNKEQLKREIARVKALLSTPVDIPRERKELPWLEKRKAKAQLDIELAMIELRQAMIESRVAKNTAQIHDDALDKNKFLVDNPMKEKYKELYQAYRKQKIDNFDVRKMAGLVGNYQIVKETKVRNAKGKVVFDKSEIETSEQSDQRVKAILGDKGYRILHYGTHDIESTTARKNFLIALQKALDERKQRGDHTKPTTMKELLGEKGLNLYKDAMKEEAKSKAFRNAVFLRSTKSYWGPKWLKRLVLWIGGPSASGKTFATDGMISKIAKGLGLMPTKGIEDIDNFVVTIDGAVEREVSQVRQLTLQAALELGHTGIEDLEVFSKGKLKDRILNAADTNKDLHIAIPETFTKYIGQPDQLSKDFARFAKTPQTLQIFSEVVSDANLTAQKVFQQSVQRMGNSRAFLKKGMVYSGITINNFFIGCESKKYDAGLFAIKYKKGVQKSEEALLAYRDVQKKYSDVHDFRIINDLVYVIFDQGQKKWRICEESDEGQIIMTTARAFNAWQMEYKAQKPANIEQEYDQFREWLADDKGGNKQNLVGPIIEVYKNGVKVDLELQNQIDELTLLIQQAKQNLALIEIKGVAEHLTRGLIESKSVLGSLRELLLSEIGSPTEVWKKKIGDMDALEVEKNKLKVLLIEAEGVFEVDIRQKANVAGLTDAKALESIYQRKLVAKALEAKTYRFDIQGHLLTEVRLDLNDLKEILTDVHVEPELVNRLNEAQARKLITDILGPITDQTYCNVDIIDHTELQEKFKTWLMKDSKSAELKKSVDALMSSDYRSTINALQKEMEMHMRLSSRAMENIAKELKIHITPEQWGMIRGKAADNLNEKMRAKFQTALIKSYKKNKINIRELNEKLDSLRKDSANDANQCLLEQMLFNGVHIGEVDKIFAKFKKEHFASTTSTGFDYIHTDNRNQSIVRITATEETAHHKRAGADTVATRELRRNGFKLHNNKPDIVPDIRQNIEVRAPSIAYNNLKLEAGILDVADKLTHITSAHFKEYKKPIIYNLLTSFYSDVSEGRFGFEKKNRQSLSAQMILKGSHEFNRRQLDKKEGAPFIYVQNIPINRHGVPLNGTSPEVIVEAKLMAEIAMLKTLADQNFLPDTLKAKIQNSMTDIDATYRKFLQETKDFNSYFKDFKPPEGKEEKVNTAPQILNELKASISSEIKEHKELKYDTLSLEQLAALAIARIFAKGDYFDENYGLTIQSLSVFLEPASIYGCKSANERFQAVSGRVDHMKSISRRLAHPESLSESEKQFYNALKAFAKGQDNLELIREKMDSTYNDHNLQGAAAAVSEEDQGATSKITRFFKSVKKVLFWHNLNTNTAESEFSSNLSQDSSGELQAHNKKRIGNLRDVFKSVKEKFKKGKLHADKKKEAVASIVTPPPSTPPPPFPPAVEIIPAEVAIHEPEAPPEESKAAVHDVKVAVDAVKPPEGDIVIPGMEEDFVLPPPPPVKTEEKRAVEPAERLEPEESKVKIAEPVAPKVVAAEAEPAKMPDTVAPKVDAAEPEPAKTPETVEPKVEAAEPAKTPEPEEPKDKAKEPIESKVPKEEVTTETKEPSEPKKEPQELSQQTSVSDKESYLGSASSTVSREKVKQTLNLDPGQNKTIEVLELKQGTETPRFTLTFEKNGRLVANCTEPPVVPEGKKYQKTASGQDVPCSQYMKYIKATVEELCKPFKPGKPAIQIYTNDKPLAIAYMLICKANGISYQNTTGIDVEPTTEQVNFIKDTVQISGLSMSRTEHASSASMMHALGTGNAEIDLFIKLTQDHIDSFSVTQCGTEVEKKQAIHTLNEDDKTLQSMLAQVSNKDIIESVRTKVANKISELQGVDQSTDLFRQPEIDEEKVQQRLNRGLSSNE